jgi:hypothetical protein
MLQQITDAHGRFQPVWHWIGCGKNDPNATPWLGVNYRNGFETAAAAGDGGNT